MRSSFDTCFSIPYRSEWDEFWRTASLNPTVSKNIYNNEYEQNTPQYDPYNIYKNSFDYYKSSTIFSTSYTTKNWYNKISAKISTSAAKSGIEEFNNLFYGRTTQQNDLYSYLRNEQPGKSRG